jgi:hypothetical protein
VRSTVQPISNGNLPNLGTLGVWFQLPFRFSEAHQVPVVYSEQPVKESQGTKMKGSNWQRIPRYLRKDRSGQVVEGISYLPPSYGFRSLIRT